MTIRVPLSILESLSTEILKAKSCGSNIAFHTGQRRILALAYWTVADPGFPIRGGGRQSPKWGQQPIIWPNFS